MGCLIGFDVLRFFVMYLTLATGVAQSNHCPAPTPQGHPSGSATNTQPRCDLKILKAGVRYTCCLSALTPSQFACCTCTYSKVLLGHFFASPTGGILLAATLLRSRSVDKLRV
jgi:hypothetical protein